ncbi:MAG: hypothetical protein KatS3mg110_2864 [Pirellulaceae bacterium]|nr:MAG: hypothetical protein KatS3mg110_2864 [Pirellulaceae bacterium]
MSRYGASWNLGLCLLPLWLWGAVVACAQNAPPADAVAPRPTDGQVLRYRRVFVPADAAATVARGYIPVKREELDKLLTAAQNPVPPAPRALLGQAEYYAVLQGDELHHGVGLLSVESTSAQWPEDVPVLVPLSPWGLVVHQASWLDSGEPAQLVASPDGTAALVAKRPGQVIVTWSIAWATPSGRAWTWSLPDATVSRLNLLAHPLRTWSLPDATVSRLNLLAHPLQFERIRGMVPLDTAGVQSEWPGWIPTDHRQAYETARSEGCVLKSFQWSGSSPLQILSELEQHPFPAAAMFRVVRQVQLSAAYTEIHDEVRLDVLGPGWEQLELYAPQELALVEAHYGNESLAWATKKSTDGLDLYQIRLPRLLSGQGHIVRLTWNCATVQQQFWTLPVWRMPAAQWSTGSLQIQVSDELQLRQLQPLFCSFVTHRLSGEGQLWEFRAQTPDASCRVLVEPRRPQLRVRAAVDTQLQTDAAYARIVADFQSDWGETYQLRCRIARPWVVDRVELQPASAWDLYQSTWQPAAGTLVVPLREPLVPGSTLRLVIGCRAPAPPRRAGWSGPTLRVVEFPGAESVELLHRLSGPPTSRLRLEQDSRVDRLNPDALPSEWRDRFESQRDGLLLRFDPASPATLLVTEEFPDVVADVQVHVDVSEQTIRETYTIRCVPEATPPRQLRVRVGPDNTGPIAWKLQGDSQPLPARMISPAAEEPEGGQWWEFDLPEGIAGPFVVLGTRESPWTDQFPVTFPSVDQAVVQTGQIWVRSSVPVDYVAQRIERLPVSDTMRQSAPHVAAFQYDPAQHGSLIVRRQTMQLSSAWVARELLTSRWYANDTALHELQYRVHHDGSQPLRIDFGQVVELDGVWLDGEPVRVAAGRSRQLQLQLSDTGRWSSIRVRYTTRTAIGRYFGSLVVPWPSVDLPVLARQWLVQVPPAYAPLEPAGARRLPSALLAGRYREAWGWWPWRLKSNSAPHAVTQDDVTQFLRAWGQLLLECGSWQELAERVAMQQRAEESLGQLTRPVWIDASAWETICAAGWPEVNYAGASRWERAVAFFNRSKLCVVMFPNAIVLSTPTGRSQYGTLDEKHWPVCLSQTDAGWAQHFWDAPAMLAMHPLETLRHNQFMLPGGFSSAVPPGEPGWVTAVLDPQPDLQKEVSVWIVNVRLVAVASLAAIGLAALAGWLIFEKRRWLLPLLVAANAAASVLLPFPWSPLLGGAAIGLGVGWVWLGLKPASGSGLRWRVAQNGMVLLAICACGLQATGQQATPVVPPQPDRPVYEIIYPVESAGRPAGEYAFVPRPLYDHLIARDSGSRQDQWYLLSAQHVVQPSGPAAPATTGVYEMASRLVVETMLPDQTIVLGYHKAESQLVQALLDRETVDVRWDAEGTHLLCNVAAAGRHVLELRLAFRWPPADESWQLHLPPCPQTELVWDGIWNEWRLETPHWFLDSTKASVRLGSTDSLRLRRRSAHQQNPAPHAVQLMWLRLQPSGAQLDWRLIVKNAAGLPRQVEVALDPRLKFDQLLEPAQASVPNGSAPRLSTAGLALPLEPMADGSALVHARFSLMAPPLGQLAVPVLFPQHATVDHWWLAIDIPQGWDLKLPEAWNAIAPLSSDFQALWGDVVAPPRYLLDLTGLITPDGVHQEWPALWVYPQPQPDAVEQTIELNVYSRVMDVTWNASIQAAQNGEKIHQVRLPNGFLIQEVNLQQADQLLPITTLLENEILTVVAQGPLPDRYTLSIRGRVEVSGGSAPVPMFRLQGSRSSSCRMRIVRHEDVAAVQVERLEGWEADDVPPADPGQPAGGRVVGQWYWAGTAGEERPAALRIVPNRLEAVGFLATRVNRDNAGWTVEFEYQVRVNQGVLDWIRLALPADWESPVEISPEQPYRVEKRPAEGRTVLAIRPPLPVTSEYKVRIRSRLSAGAERIRRVPEIAPMDVTRSQRFVLLPSRIENMLYTWTTSGLQERVLPQFFQMARQGDIGWQSYSVVGSHFHASLERVERVPEASHVTLADGELIWQHGAEYAGVIAFEIQPSGLSECALIVPEQTELLQIYLDGVPQGVTQASRNAVRIAIGPALLPQRLEIVFRGQAKSIHDGYSVALPQLEGLSVEWTLLTLRHAWNESVTARLPEGAIDSPIRGQQLRWERLLRLWESGVSAVGELDADVRTDWLSLMTPHLLWADHQRRVAVGEGSSPQTGSPAGREVLQDQNSPDGWWERLKSQLDPAAVEWLSGKRPVPVDDLRALWDVMGNLAERRQCWALPGQWGTLELNVTATAQASQRRWLPAVLLLLGGGLWSAAWRLRLYKSEWFVYQHALLVLAGWCLACFVRPIGWGLFLIGLAIFASWSGHWRWRRF